MANGAISGSSASDRINRLADSDELLGETDELVAMPSLRGRRWRLFTRRRSGVVALGILAALYALAFLGPFVYQASPTDANAMATNLSPSLNHPLGTDELGRDELARILSGGRLSLTLGLFSVFIAVTLGTTIGLLAGFYRGAVEVVLMRLVDAAMAIPYFFLVLIEITVFGNSAPILILVIGFTFWSQIARIMHSETIALREREFVEASTALGVSRNRIMLRHILPHLFPSMIVMATLAVAWAILTESALSFLGLGIQPPAASWGSILQNAQSYIFLDPGLAVFPGVFIAITVLSFNLLGDSLRDVL
jgi:peptide/nickel transport system permease protein